MVEKTCYNCGTPITKEYCEDNYPNVCEHWTQEKTNTAADRIRAMNDRELASFFADRIIAVSLDILGDEREELTAVQVECERNWAMGVILQELRKPADETVLFCTSSTASGPPFPSRGKL